MRMTISLSDQLASHFLTLTLNRDRAVTMAWSNAGPPAHYSAYDESGQNYRCHYRPAPYPGEIPSTQQDRNGVPSQDTGNPYSTCTDSRNDLRACETRAPH